MLVLKNAEGSKFNVNLDNYLVVTLENQRMEEISYEQLEWLVETTNGFHSEPLCVEISQDLENVMDYLFNIEKLVCFSETKLGQATYYKVQRNLLGDLN
jgi:hypothetical protein